MHEETLDGATHRHAPFSILRNFDRSFLGPWSRHEGVFPGDMCRGPGDDGLIV